MRSISIGEGINPMKICHMTSAHESGDVRVFRKECISLAQAGHEVWLVARGESREEEGVKVIGLGDPPSGRLARMTGFACMVYRRALELDADVYHFHDPELLPYGVKLKKAGKKVIFDSHENAPAQISEKNYLPGPVRRMISALYRMYETGCVRKLDAVIVPCTFDGKNIFEGRARKTFFVPNYPRLSDFAGRTGEVIKDPDSVCYVGGLTYARGIYHLIKAVSLAGKRLVLAGRFSDAEFEERVRSMPEFSCVDYLGSLPNTQIAGVIEKCAVGANTLLDIGQYHHIDTFGLKVFEYMAMELPVLLPDYPYMRRMAEKYKFGMCVRPDDPEDIASAIRYLTEKPEEAERMGRNGRRAVETEFNWGTAERVLLECYESLKTDDPER